MKNLILVLFASLLFTVSCTKTNKNDLYFDDQRQWTKSIIDSLKEDLTFTEQKKFVLYYRKGSYSENNKEILIDSINSAIGRVKDILKNNSYPQKIYLIMTASRKEIEYATGMNVKALASGYNNTAIFVYSPEIRPYFRHELFHIIAFNIWGEPANRLLDEGGAIYSDNECLFYGNPISTINKYLYEENKWFKVDELINDFSGKARENDLIAYLQAGFIFRYLYENYRIEKLEKLWQTGFDNFEMIYGFNISELQQKIKEEMQTIELKKVDWDELMEKGCG